MHVKPPWVAVLPELEHIAAAQTGDSPRLEWIGGYMDRTAVFAVGDRFVLKAYFHAAETKWSREIAAYEFLREAPLPLAAMVGTGRLSTGTPWLLVERLPGRILADWPQALAESRRIWSVLGVLLARLHALSPGVPAEVAELSRRFEHKMSTRVGDYLADLHRIGAHPEWLAELNEWLRPRASADRFRVENLCFVHGDFSARNVLVREALDGWDVSGIIDFEKAEFADPALDIAKMVIAESEVRPVALGAFRRGYVEGGGGAVTSERVAFYVCYIAIDAALWASASDPAYFDRIIRISRAAIARPDSVWPGPDATSSS